MNAEARILQAVRTYVCMHVCVLIQLIAFFGKRFSVNTFSGLTVSLYGLNVKEIIFIYKDTGFPRANVHHFLLNK